MGCRVKTREGDPLVTLSHPPPTLFRSTSRFNEPLMLSHSPSPLFYSRRNSLPSFPSSSALPKPQFLLLTPSSSHVRPSVRPPLTLIPGTFFLPFLPRVCRGLGLDFFSNVLLRWRKKPRIKLCEVFSGIEMSDFMKV